MSEHVNPKDATRATCQECRAEFSGELPLEVEVDRHQITSGHKLIEYSGGGELSVAARQALNVRMAEWFSG